MGLPGRLLVRRREFLQRDGKSPRELEIVKHWYQWLLWGRFAYNPDYSNERIIALLSARYPEVDGAQLLDAFVLGLVAAAQARAAEKDRATTGGTR